MNAAFVAAARWASANGWQPTCTTLDGWREYRWAKDRTYVYAQPTPSRWQIVVVEPGKDHLIAGADSMAQALDYLVVAGVFPQSFASWGQYTEAIDHDGEPVWFGPDEEVRYGKPGDYAEEHGCEALYRRLPSQREES